MPLLPASSKVARLVAPAQVVGTVEVHGDQVSGTGVVIGQGCSGPQVVRFCKGPSSGVISLAASYRRHRRYDSGDHTGWGRNLAAGTDVVGQLLRAAGEA